MSEQGKEEPELKAGYLVLRMKPGQGVLIFDCIEVRIASINKQTGELNIAIKAPKEILIRRLK